MFKLFEFFRRLHPSETMPNVISKLTINLESLQELRLSSLSNRKLYFKMSLYSLSGFIFPKAGSRMMF